MGRASKLTDEQWVMVERRHLVDGESINALAAELGINESSLRRRIRPNKAESPRAKNNLRFIAEKKVLADAESMRISQQIAELPFSKQRIVSDLAARLSAISENLGLTAQNCAASAYRLSVLANQQLEKVDDADPMSSVAPLQAHAALQKLCNAAAEMPTNLVRANKDQMEAQLERERAAEEKKASVVPLRPQLTREEWMAAHGVGTPARSAE